MTRTITILEARNNVETNGGDFGALLVEWTNHPETTMDAKGDVWDGRGYWWDNDRKGEFCDWVARLGW